MACIEKREGKAGTTYRVKIKYKGNIINTATFDTHTEAKNWGTLQDAEKVKGKPNDMRLAKRTTLAELLDSYAKKKSVQKKGCKEEQDRIRFMIENYPLAQEPVANIHKSDVAGLRDELLEDGKAAQTVQHELKLIRQSIAFALDETRLSLPENPAASVAMPKLPPARNRRLEKGEYELLLAACKFHPWLNECIVIAVETAMRRGEILSLKPCMIDLEKRYIHLPKTKNNHARDVPMSSRVLEVIKPLVACKSKDDFLFPIEPNSLTRAFRNACKRACVHVLDQEPGCRRSCQKPGKKGCPGIQDLHFHDLRHEAISRLFENTSLRTEQIMLISGHKTYAMLKRYINLRPDTDLVDALG